MIYIRFDKADAPYVIMLTILLVLLIVSLLK